MPVKGGKEIIDALNVIITGELTAINQYFLHAKMLQNWGFNKLYKKIWAESIDEMKHADMLIERVLYLDGIPNVQRLGRVRIGENVAEMFDCDEALELEAIPRLQETIELCRTQGDHGTAVLLEGILTSEEEHLDWIETQKSLIKSIGLERYCAEMIGE